MTFSLLRDDPFASFGLSGDPFGAHGFDTMRDRMHALASEPLFSRLHRIASAPDCDGPDCQQYVSSSSSSEQYERGADGKGHVTSERTGETTATKDGKQTVEKQHAVYEKDGDTVIHNDQHHFRLHDNKVTVYDAAGKVVYTGDYDNREEDAIQIEKLYKIIKKHSPPPPAPSETAQVSHHDVAEQVSALLQSAPPTPVSVRRRPRRAKRLSTTKRSSTKPANK
jgi:hypothetical protein